MLKQRIRKGPFIKTDCWFDEKPRWRILGGYIQSPTKKSISMMKRTPFHTIHIDLNQDNETLLDGMDKGTSYEIRRAEREGITTDTNGEIEEFISFFNAFAKAKGIEGTNINYLKYDRPLLITRAFFENDLLVMHAYIDDDKRGRLNMSASRVIRKDEDFKKMRALIGYANRYLHFKDMVQFRDTGKLIYDFGGYAKDTEDKALKGINRFKESFGGSVVEEYNYVPNWR